jgi:hypothetical protein
MHGAFLIFFFLSLTSSLGVESERAKVENIVWRRFGLTENIMNVKKLLGQRKKEQVENLMMTKLKEALEKKHKENEEKMEEKRRFIFKIYLEPHMGSSSVLKDLYNRF